jgi:hypothetical protein
MQEFSNKYLGTKKLVSITKGIFSLRIEYFQSGGEICFVSIKYSF